MDEGIGIRELSRRACDLFGKQEALEKRRFLNFLFSNCSWKNGELEVTYRQPFDIDSGNEQGAKNEEGR